MRRFLFIALLLSNACVEERHPVSPPEVEPPTEGGDDAEVANDPVRQDYRLVLAQCDDARAAMGAEVSEAEQRRRRQTLAAAAAYVVGESTDVRDDSDVPLDGMGGQPDCPRDRDPNRAGPCATPTPTVGTRAEPSPAQMDEDTANAEADIQAESIDHAVNETDEFLFAHPDTIGWGANEKAEWTARRNRLAQLCGYSAAGPTGPAPAADEAAD